MLAIFSKNSNKSHLFQCSECLELDLSILGFNDIKLVKANFVCVSNNVLIVRVTL